MTRRHPSIHAVTLTAVVVFAVALSACTAAPNTPPPGTTIAGTIAAPNTAPPPPTTTPRTIDPVRRNENLNRMIDGFGLDAPKHQCVVDALNSDPALNGTVVDAVAAAKALIQHAIDCGARDQITVTFIAKMDPSSPAAGQKECVKTVFDKLTAQQFIGVAMGDTAINTQVQTDITKTCTTPTT